MTGLQAVLFDMDGTLVDTEHLWGRALFELAERLGGTLSEQARAATVGTALSTSITIVHADLGVARSAADARADVDRVEGRVADLMGAGVSWRPGARELLTAVRSAGLSTALVTTTARRLTDLVLGSVTRDLGELPFDVTVCGDEVPARKPDPAPYLQAAAALGVDVTRCVVLEDSVVGVTAGLAAGAAVVGLPGLQPIPPAPGLVLRESLVGLGAVDLAGLVNRSSSAG